LSNVILGKFKPYIEKIMAVRMDSGMEDLNWQHICIENNNCKNFGV
jgi:hypothetical protein